MTEQPPLFHYEPSENDPQPELAYIKSIHHGHDGLSFVKINYKGEEHLVAINTSQLSYDEAELVCQQVSEWWNESVDPQAIYQPSEIISC